ncbi:uncharacterized protein [Prorops nasuta]|uniref:uncharacterized protein n=1 Tax=Prorops nasuta TaxID=863751 RepID=UPI0034D00A91
MKRICLIFSNIAIILAFEKTEILKELGEKAYSLIKEKSNLPQHGVCWHKALRVLKNGCSNFNDHQHSVLALQLANCFLDDTGHQTYDCHEKLSDIERKQCINDMTDRAFGVYNEFYTHATHVCFYLSYEIWQKETEDTVKLLYQVSSKMTNQLLEASKMQETVLESQKESLQIQNELLDDGKHLRSLLQSSAETVNSMVVDFQNTATYQKELLHNIFSYIQTFQNWIIGEVSWFQSIFYYIASCILCALFSSARRTMDARIFLFATLSFNIIIERILIQYYDKINYITENDKIQLMKMIWLCRKVALTLCALILLYTYSSYRDRFMENNKALKRIEQKLNLLHAIENLQQIKEPVRFSKRLQDRQLLLTSSKEKLKCIR